MAWGGYALQYNSTGQGNVGVGFEAGRYKQAGNYNTLIGYNAGRVGSNHDKSNCVIIGADAGAGSSATGSGNILLGYMAGYNESGSNKLYIENSNSAAPLIYGEFDNDILVVNGDLQLKDGTVAGNIAIYEGSGDGTNKVTIQSQAMAADYTLTLPAADGTADQVLSTDGSGTLSWATTGGGGDGSSLDAADGSPTDALYIDNAGKVGIGTTAPEANLHVWQNTADAVLRVEAESAGDGRIVVDGYAASHIDIMRNSLSRWRIDRPSGLDDLYFTNDYGDSADDFTHNVMVWDYDTGKVGIGTTSPSEKLQVVDNSTSNVMSIKNSNAAGYSTLNFKDSSNSGVGSIGYANSSAAWNPGCLYLKTATGTPLILASGDFERMRIATDGNIGIGTTDPQYPLHVYRSSAGSFDEALAVLSPTMTAEQKLGITFGRDDSTLDRAEMYFHWAGNASYSNRLSFGFHDASDMLNIQGNGEVGIGTADPGGRLHIHATSVCVPLLIQNTAATGASYVRFRASDNSSIFDIGGGNPSSGFNPLKAYISIGSGKDFYISHGTSERICVTSTGNVGIGTTSPQGKLDIAGQFGSKIHVNGDSGAAKTIDWNNGNTQHITLTANCTLTFSNGYSGRKYTLIVKQDATGSRTITWPGTARWSGGTAPTLTTTASKTDYIDFFYNSVDSKYDGVAARMDF